ncbi:MAG: hypothetical protein K2X90_03495 [Candidatus Babeliaceae bacterium]|nr:hypothetical protein [Candidatus Babeliaceae bacterium]
MNFKTARRRASKLIMLVLLSWLSSVYAAQWAVVGAGPAGIVIVGLLLDLGTPREDIVWIDPEFNVGRMGQYYSTVPGNTKTSLYIEFIQACRTFQDCAPGALQELQKYELALEYPLSIIVKPLQQITACMSQKVTTQKTMLTGLEFANDTWHIECANGFECDAQRVVLATGSYPRSLNYTNSPEIPLDCALNQQLLSESVTPDDTVAVVGSAHSAVLVLKFLSEMPVGRIINFYKKPFVYTTDMGGWLLYSSSGLKGVAAEWAKNVLEKNPPCNLVRVYNSEKARAAWLPLCTKIVYAAGYDRNPIPGCNPDMNYDTQTGKIAPGLFGIGIAFPEVIIDPAGNQEHKIGLNSFMQHALEMLPEWMRTKDVLWRFKEFEELFTIQVL